MNRSVRAAGAVVVAISALHLGVAPASAATVLAVVPFAQPGAEKLQSDQDATEGLVAALTQRGFTAKPVAAIDHLAVVADAGRICAETGATGIMVPEMRTERAVRRRNEALTVVQYYATRVDLRLSLVRCDGSQSWTGSASGEKDSPVAGGPPSGAPEIAEAIGRALDLFQKRIPDTARPGATATPAPKTKMTTGPKVALVPFAQTGSEPDPSLDLATELARKRIAAHDAAVVVTEPGDFLIATKDAAAMCARYGASRLVMGTLRWEQTPASDGVATHAEIRLTTVGCNGRVIGAQDEAGDHLHADANSRAGVSAAIEDAFGRWTEPPIAAPKPPAQ
jgi:hypothetical protein